MDIAERLDLLFKTVTKSDGQEYSYREIEELTGDAISSTAIWKLRAGKTQNPRRSTLEALSRAFQVPVSFFLDESVSSEDIPGYRRQYRDQELLEQIALRSQHLDEEGKQAILDMIDYVVKAQQGGGDAQKERQSAHATAVG